MRSTWQKMLSICFGCFILALAMNYFFIPNHIAAGGISGLAIVINYVFPFFGIGALILVGNLVLFAMAFILLGKQFGIMTLVGSISYSAWVIFFEHFAPMTKPLVQDQLLVILIGSSISGIGLSFVFTQNASTGGTDILGAILNNITHIGLAKSLFAIDAIVVMLGGACISLENALYAIVAIYTQAMVLENMIAGFGRRIVMNITTEKVDEVNAFIIEKMHRGTSIYPMQGGFSGNPHLAIVAVVHHKEYIRIKDYVDEVDPRAFVFVYSANEVLGEGFTYAPGQRVSNPQPLNEQVVFTRPMPEDTDSAVEVLKKNDPTIEEGVSYAAGQNAASED